MRRHGLTLLVAALVASWAWQSASAQQTADQLIAKNLQSKGGAENLKAVQSIRQTGRVNTQGMEVTITMIGKRPNMTRKELALGDKTIVYGFDGTTAWAVNPLASGTTTPVVITGPEADATKQESDFDGPLVDYKAKGYQIDLVGPDTVSGKPAQHLKLVSKDQHVQHVYLDDTTGLEMKIVTQTQMGTLEQELSDYRDVNGLKMPFRIRTFANGTPVMEITMSKVEFNVKLDDALFKMPRR